MPVLSMLPVFQILLPVISNEHDISLLSATSLIQGGQDSPEELISLDAHAEIDPSEMLDHVGFHLVHTIKVLHSGSVLIIRV